MKSLRTIIPLVAAVGIGSPALAQFNFTSQSRQVFAYAVATEIEGFSDSASAPDFSVFSGTATDNDGNAEASPFNYASASANQESTLAPDSLSYYGGLSTGVQENGYGFASTYFSVTFNVASPTGFTLAGGSAVYGGFAQSRGVARMGDALEGIGFSGGGFDEFWEPGQEFDLSGLLESGVDYTLTANFTATSSVSALSAPLGSIVPNRFFLTDDDGSESGFTFAATSAVPESGTVAAGVLLGGLVLWRARGRRA